jgi:hypothetical protein
MYNVYRPWQDGAEKRIGHQFVFISLPKSLCCIVANCCVNHHDLGRDSNHNVQTPLYVTIRSVQQIASTIQGTVASKKLLSVLIEKTV